MLPIVEVARSLGLDDEFVIPYGPFQSQGKPGRDPTQRTQGQVDCCDWNDSDAGGQKARRRPL